MEQDMATIQAQLAQLTAQLTHNAERTSMPSVPTLDVPYGQGYQAHQYPQFSAYDDNWGYQRHSQSRGNMYSNACNSDWRGYSNQMWDEPQQFQQSGYWQQDEFYSRPMQPPQHHPQQFQSNSSMAVNYNEILEGLISLTQGSQKEEQLQPSEEFYSRPMQPPQCPPQQFQSHSSMPKNYNEILDGLISLAQGSRKEEQLQPSEEFYQWPCAPQQSAQFDSGTSLDNDAINKLLTSLNQGVENRIQEIQDRTNKVDELERQVGEIMEIMAQIQDQSELPNSPIENSKEVEIEEATTLEGDMEDEVGPEPSTHSPNMDELLPQAEDEEDDLGSLEEFLSQTPEVPMLSNFGSDVPIEIHSNIIPLNVPFPCRFVIPNNEESEKDIVEALPKAQEIEFDDMGQATTIIVNLAQFKIPEISKGVVFVINFESEKDSKPSSPILILILFYSNTLILMIQAPTREFKPLPNHFKYHLPLKDKFYALELRGV